MLTEALWKNFLCGIIVVLGLFECGHLAGVFLGMSISDCGLLVLVLIALTMITGLIILCRKWRNLLIGRGVFAGCGFGIVAPVFCVLVISQIYYILTTNILQTPGDITMETVYSFLTTGKIYSVSPLTGGTMTGMPLRYEILCLPTVYTLLCRWFGSEPELIVNRVLPVLVLFMTYMSYYLLGAALFGREAQGRKKTMWFLVFVGLLFWLCEGSVYLEGYGVLHAGWLGTTIRSCVLVPLCLYGALERKWLVSVICILAEACIVWTLWGLGVCAVVLAGVLLIDLCFFRRKVKGEDIP